MVAQLLEVLPELTPEFELLVVNDGSTDATDEVARELSLDYPQVCIVTHATRQGRSAAIRSGFARSSGGSVLIVDEDCHVNLTEVHKLWRHTPSHDVIVSRPALRTTVGRIPRAPRKAVKAMPSSPLQLVHRRVLKGWLSAGTPEDLMAYLSRHGYPFYEVEVRELGEAQTAGTSATAIGQKLNTTAGNAGRVDKIAAQGAATDPKRPNYLARFKDFALGE